MATVSLTPETLQYVANLSAFVSKDRYTPILSGVAVTVSGGKITAIATDRYAIAQYKGETAKKGELPRVVIPAKLLTTAAEGSKVAAKVRLTHNETDNTITFDWGYGSASDSAIAGDFPPLEQVFTFDESDWGGIPGGTVLNPVLLAPLSSLTRASRRVADRLILFEFHGQINAKAHPNKLRPIRATGDGYTVLIQPNLKTR